MSYRTPLKRYSREGLRQAERGRIFAETFTTFAGNDEGCGDPYVLTDWVERNIWKPLFGTGHVDRRTRRWVRQYRRALIGLHRHWGKSQFVAVLALTVATMEPVPNGQYGIVADTLDNTKMIFGYIKTIIRANKSLAAQWSIYKGEIVNELTGQTITVFPYKEAALQGKHFNLLIGDELHVWRDEYVWDAAVSGQGKVRNALTIGVTTAGSSRDGFLFKLWRKLKRDPRAFVCWLGIDDSDDPKDRRCWKKVVAGGRMTMEEIEDQYQALPLHAFERYILNRTPMDEEEAPFMRRADVEACARRAGEVDWSRFFTVGIDGATSGDTLAVVAYQRQEGGDAFAEWTWDEPGASGVYDLTDVADVLQGLARRKGRPLLCCDPARLQFLVNWLDRERGVEVFKVAQRPSTMCPASELLARSVKTHSALMRGTPVLAAHCVNAKAAESRAYGRQLTSERHGKGSRRIDAAVAAAMAMWAYDNNEPADWSGGVFSIQL